MLGHQLQDNQRLYIMILTPSPAPDADQRQQALQGLRQVTGQIEQNLRERGVTAEQLDSAIDEACQDVRYNQQS